MVDLPLKNNLQVSNYCLLRLQSTDIFWNQSYKLRLVSLGLVLFLQVST
jgi:hypothetical protein